MKQDKQKQLLLLLEEYFADHDINRRDFIAKNPVAHLLKKKLSSIGRWKNLPRGKPNPLYLAKT